MHIVHGAGQRMARMCRRIIRCSMPPRVRGTVHGPDLCGWRGSRSFFWDKDLLLAYPDAACVEGRPSQYQALHDFYHANKKIQRDKLSEYFLVPKVGKPPFVVRPLRHERGEGFEVVQTVPEASKAGTNYWASLWHRTCEYRVFYVRGEKVLTLLKRVPEGTRQDIPWSHGVSSFVTVHESNNDRLRHTKFYEKAKVFLKDYPFHFIAIDVLYHDCAHRVVEVNFSPNITISANLDILARSLSGPFLYDPTHRTSVGTTTPAA